MYQNTITKHNILANVLKNNYNAFLNVSTYHYISQYSNKCIRIKITKPSIFWSQTSNNAFAL